MKTLSILSLLITYFFTLGCTQPTVNENEIATNTVTTSPAIVDENSTEVPASIDVAPVEDNTNTTTKLDAKKATPAPLLPVIKQNNSSSSAPVAANVNTGNTTSPKSEMTAEKLVTVAPAKTNVLIDNHEAFNTMLQKFVSSNGTVNYAGWKKSETDLDEYLSSLAAAIPGSSTSRNEALAYWINAYNAYTVKLILKNYPVAKITDLNGGKPWDVQWITLAGKKYSLNDIENKVIRPTFNEPRIHFAVNCAAKSCPPLANKAFTATNLNTMLEQRTKAFINSDLNTITANKLSLSKIFDWYKEDFGNVIGFVNKYAATDVNKNATIAFNDYNWALNK